MIYHSDPWLTLHLGEVLDVLRTLPEQSIHAAMTSPPFYGLRDYGCAGQIGLEASPSEHIAKLVEVFREVRRVLRDDGTLWIEYGDAYNSGTSAKRKSSGDSTDVGAWQSAGEMGDERINAPGLKPKDLLGLPFMLAFALREPYYTGAIREEKDRIWLAAMLDGEGCISIHRRPEGTRNYAKHTLRDGTVREYVRKHASYQPKVEITNTDRAIMDRVVALAGGQCDTKQLAGTYGRKQTIYRWNLTADKARAFLAEVYPHVVGKRQQVRLGYSCPSSGDQATAAWQALKDLHKGVQTTFDLAAPPALFEPGWYLRDVIVWHKVNPMPESVRDRTTKSHSYVLLFSKRPRYYYDQDAVREPAIHAGEIVTLGPTSLSKGQANGAGIKPSGNGAADQVVVAAGRNLRSVWTIPTQPYPEAHYATWPEKLVERMILAGSPAGGVVLDPFFGSGTTGLVAERLGRHTVGIELNPDYCAQALERIAQGRRDGSGAPIDMPVPAPQDSLWERAL